MLAVEDPGFVGWNSTLNGTTCPAARTRGSVIPVTWKPEPKPPIEVMVTGDAPWFTIESVNDWLPPTGTLPNVTLPFLTPTLPPPLAPAARPWHPARVKRLRVTARAVAKR